MASGNFPMNPESTGMGVINLLEAKKLLIEFSNDYFKDDSMPQEPDNAFSDGGYIERIWIAIEMINACLEKE